MKITNTRIATLFVLLLACSGVGAAQETQDKKVTKETTETQEKKETKETTKTTETTQEKPGHVDYSFNGGTIIPKREIAVNENATGVHERLFARLKSSLFLGGKVGFHGRRLGVEAGVFRTAANIQVNNEAGVHFPNHGENITLARADLLYYPFPEAFEKKLHPYISVGVGGNFFSVDTDNIDNQENFIKPTVSLGCGGKFKLDGADGNIGFEVLLRYERMLGKAPIQTGGFVIVSAGLVFSQYPQNK